MLFSTGTYLVLVSANFICRSRLPTSKSFTGSLTNAHLCKHVMKSRPITFTTNLGWGLGKGQRHLPRVIKMGWT